MRQKGLLLVVVLLAVSIGSAKAQSFIKFPYEKFRVSQTEITVYLGEEGKRTIGTEFEIIGGQMAYSFSWSFDGDEVGTDPTLEITQLGEYLLTITDANDCTATVTYTVPWNVGIDQVPVNKVTLYPSPTDGPLTVQSSETDALQTITVYSSTGVKVYTYQASDSDSLESGISIDLSELSVGVYLVTLQFENRKITKTIIKK